MLKGLALTPPILGRISIGQVVERNGKRLPQKDNQFTITTQVQTPEGWLKHPIDAELRKNNPKQKLFEIPIRLLFNDPSLNLQAQYCLFDRQTARPVCIGDGDSCQRQGQDGLEKLACLSPTLCPFAQAGCKPYGRLHVLIREENKNTEPNATDSNTVDYDPLGSFIFRTSGFNSIRTLASRLRYFQAVSGNLLSCLPLALRIRGKSTRQSFGRPIFYVDLTLPTGLTVVEALKQAQQLDKQRKAAGYDQTALDEAARQGFANGWFSDDEDSVRSVLEEFYPDDNSPQHQANPDDRKNSANEHIQNKTTAPADAIGNNKSVEETKQTAQITNPAKIPQFSANPKNPLQQKLKQRLSQQT